MKKLLLLLSFAAVALAVSAPCSCFHSSCAEDLNADGAVNTFDLLILLQRWGTVDDALVSANLDGTGTVNTFDLLVLLQNWGKAGCDPQGGCLLDQEQALWLEGHNFIRRAANLPELTWSRRLAQSAFDWVSTCPTNPAHSSQGSTRPANTGENLGAWFGVSSNSFQSNTYSAPGVTGLQSLGQPGRLGGEKGTFFALSSGGCGGQIGTPFTILQGWSTLPVRASFCSGAGNVNSFSESSGYDCPTNTCNSPDCGHWRQLIRRTTTSVGCAAYHCPSTPGQYWWAVCQYDTPVFSGVHPYGAGNCADLPSVFAFEGLSPSFNDITPIEGSPFWDPLSPTNCPSCSQPKCPANDG